MKLLNRAGAGFVALETTLLVHGVPRADAAPLAEQLAKAVREGGEGRAEPAVVGIVSGCPIVGLTDDELATLLAAEHVEKVNTANLGVIMHRGQHGATTVSSTVELAARAGIRVMATGGIGGVHRDFGSSLDISSDLATLARCPVAVVTSGVKSLLDVRATREALETLGVPVVGYRTDSFPAFYVRETKIAVDARFDDDDELAAYAQAELARTGRGLIVANPCPADQAMPEEVWEDLLMRAQKAGPKVHGRDVTPVLLAQIHHLSGGASLAANIALAEANARLAGRLCGLLQVR